MAVCLADGIIATTTLWYSDGLDLMWSLLSHLTISFYTACVDGSSFGHLESGLVWTSDLSRERMPCLLITIKNILALIHNVTAGKECA